MSRLTVAVGAVLIGVSVLSVVQTAREMALWSVGQADYTETSLSEWPVRFGGHEYAVRDDQPTTAPSYAEYDGTIQPLMDGAPLGGPSRAHVRRGLTDLGRHFGWCDAWLFRERATGQTTLWLARRLQPTDGDSPRFELTTVASDGARRTEVLRAWQLGTDYRRYRATQFIRGGSWGVLPFALGDIGLFPLLLLVFPVGTFMLGTFVIRRGMRSSQQPAVQRARR